MFGKELEDRSSTQEQQHRWHNKCIKRFFGTSKMPILDVSEERLQELANTTVNKGLTVPGVQKKLSLHLSTDIDSRLTIVNYPTGYILKPQTEEYDNLPEFENFAMVAAKIAGIKTVPNALIINDNKYAYITKRVDRNIKTSKDFYVHVKIPICRRNI